ncbi:hypothetical protein [Hankyongella ginsenosidimutans]|uniref:antitoxin Xre/MbcA/ParS-like domain-containing protein n=1 Tax=Hankyongella ginsenosidimutans TaxID=1763828 RepID=UPI001CA33CA8|nr:hypothetical protein [Hankyongella ginsenosidimutans]
MEEWAGPLAGSSALMEDMGIARSTLHDWQRRGEVIALLRARASMSSRWRSSSMAGPFGASATF